MRLDLLMDVLVQCIEAPSFITLRINKAIIFNDAKYLLKWLMVAITVKNRDQNWWDLSDEMDQDLISWNEIISCGDVSDGSIMDDVFDQRIKNWEIDFLIGCIWILENFSKPFDCKAHEYIGYFERNNVNFHFHANIKLGRSETQPILWTWRSKDCFFSCRSTSSSLKV